MITTRKTTTSVCWMAVMMMVGGLMGCLEPESAPEPGDESGIECGDGALYSFTHETCGPMDVAGDDDCYCLLGFAWNGTGCETVTGCGCTGEDCDSLSETEEDCLAAHESCIDDETAISCGDEAAYSFTTDGCGTMDVAGQGECFCAMGFFWDGEQCAALDGVCECVGEDCDALYQTMDECVSAHESCEEPVRRIECGNQALHTRANDSCEAMDAVGEGACYCAMGYKWDGESCVSLDGSCECVGVDCDSLFQTEAECLSAHESC